MEEALNALVVAVWWLEAFKEDDSLRCSEGFRMGIKVGSIVDGELKVACIERGEGG